VLTRAVIRLAVPAASPSAVPPLDRPSRPGPEAALRPAPAPGWYEDPLDPADRRWWNGQAWTEHVAVPTGPLAVPALRSISA
jgi:hypothetical protein